MALRMTITVETNKGDHGTMSFTRVEEGTHDNERFYPSDALHLGAMLTTGVRATLVALIGGEDKVLSAKGALALVRQEDHAVTLDCARQLHLLEMGEGPRSIVNTEELARLRGRDALLGAMEIAGVDNWEGMDNVDRPEGI